MKFNKMVNHLSMRGFVTRKLWKGRSVLVFEMDNSPSIQTNDKRRISWSPNLAEMKANDWEKLPFFWTNPKDNFLPFSSPKLKSLLEGVKK